MARCGTGCAHPSASPTLSEPWFWFGLACPGATPCQLRAGSVCCAVVLCVGCVGLEGGTACGCHRPWGSGWVQQGLVSCSAAEGVYVCCCRQLRQDIPYGAAVVFFAAFKMHLLCSSKDFVNKGRGCLSWHEQVWMVKHNAAKHPCMLCRCC